MCKHFSFLCWFCMKEGNRRESTPRLEFVRALSELLATGPGGEEEAPSAAAAAAKRLSGRCGPHPPNLRDGANSLRRQSVCPYDRIFRKRKSSNIDCEGVDGRPKWHVGHDWGRRPLARTWTEVERVTRHVVFVLFWTGHGPAPASGLGGWYAQFLLCNSSPTDGTRASPRSRHVGSHYLDVF